MKGVSRAASGGPVVFIMSETIEMMCTFLNAANCDREVGEGCMNCISRYYNTYSDTCRLTEELLASLSKAGKKRFLAIWSLCGLELVYSYIKVNRNPWDDRKRQAMEYAWQHWDDLARIFCENTGVPVSFDACTPASLSMSWFRGWVSDFDREFFRNHPDLEVAADRLVDLHPTIKTSFFGGVVRAVMDRNARFYMV